MGSFHQNMMEYKKQLEKGAIQDAYRGLMDYFNALRIHFKKNYPGHSVSGSVYYGFMDMTYFAIIPKSLKRQKLKIAIVFLHKDFRFEVWLAGFNKKIQTKYWNLIKESNWKQYCLPNLTKGVDAILEHVLVKNPDFTDLGELTKQIENGTQNFIENVECFLTKKSP